MNVFVRAGIVLSAVLAVVALSLSLTQMGQLHVRTTPSTEPPPLLHFSFYLPENRDGFFLELIAGAERAAMEKGIVLSFHSIAPSQQDLAMAAYTGVDGVVVCPYMEDKQARAHLEKIQDRGIPLVLINHHIPHDKPWPYVGSNSFDIGRRMGSIALGTTHGPLRIGVVYSDKSPGILAEQELVEMGLSVSLGERLRSPITRFRTGMSPLEAEALIQRLFRGTTLPTTLVFTDETDTVVAAQALIDLNLVGRVQLVGSGKSDAVRDHIRTGVIAGSIAMNPDLIGYTAVTSLLELKTLGYTSSTVDTGLTVVEGVQE